MWNRGGTHIRFKWTDAKRIVWTLPDPDKVEMVTSPCTVARAIPELRNVISSEPLTDNCLTFRRELRFGDDDRYVYAVGKQKPATAGSSPTSTADPVTPRTGTTPRP